jgi:hypothetical protein
VRAGRGLLVPSETIAPSRRTSLRWSADIESAQRRGGSEMSGCQWLLRWRESAARQSSPSSGGGVASSGARCRSVAATAPRSGPSQCCATDGRLAVGAPHERREQCPRR